MKGSAQKIKATTQSFTEIQDIVDDIVLLSGGAACLILEVTATNFSLQSKEEQQSKILSYASLLNSLSFSIQILVISRQLDINSYLSLLENEAKRAPNQEFSKHILLYKDFVANLVKTNTVLDKKFYIIIPFSFLEKGPGAVMSVSNKGSFLKEAKVQLRSKSQSIIQELIRIGLKSKVLGKNELVSLYYEIYNSDGGRIEVK